MRDELLRFADWASPVPAARRELRTASPAVVDERRAPVLFVPGLGHGAWAFEEHWLAHTASRGFVAHALTPREPGDLRAYTHDVVQAAAAMPRQAVLVGHGTGALVVARALGRYPARAAVLAAPVMGGWATLRTALAANPWGTVPALFGGRLRQNRAQLFSSALPATQANAYLKRLRAAGSRPQKQLLRAGAPPVPVGAPPVLVVGSPDDRVVPRASLDRTATRYGGAPLLFPGMGHDLMLDTNWVEPLDAILDWLTKQLSG